MTDTTFSRCVKSDALQTDTIKKIGFGHTDDRISMCAGPPIVPPKTPSEINISTKVIWDVFTGVPLDKAGIPGVYPGYVDVRDVARAVVYAVEHPEETDGERFILARWYSPPRKLADLLGKMYSGDKELIEAGTEGESYDADFEFPSRIVFDGSKIVRATGKEYIPWEQTVVDTIEGLRHLL